MRDWQQAGVWQRLHQELLQRLHWAGPHRLEPGVYGQRVHPGKKGGAATGPNSTDRGKAGTKRHLLTDRHGLPLAFLLTGANVHDSVPLAQLLDAVVPVKGRRGRPRQRPGKLHARQGV